MESTWEVNINFRDGQGYMDIRMPNSDYRKLISSGESIITVTNYLDYGTEDRPPASEQLTIFMQHVTWINATEN